YVNAPYAPLASLKRAARTVSLRPSSRVYVPEEKSVNPYSFTTAGFAASATAGSVLVCTVPCNCHPPNPLGRIAARVSGFDAAGDAPANAETATRTTNTGEMTRIHFMRDRKPGNIAVAIRLQGTEESFQNPSHGEDGRPRPSSCHTQNRRATPPLHGSSAFSAI